jgi:hypothetical protein
MHHQEDRQGQMNDAEIMTTAFVASLFFPLIGNFFQQQQSESSRIQEKAVQELQR